MTDHDDEVPSFDELLDQSSFGPGDRGAYIEGLVSKILGREPPFTEPELKVPPARGASFYESVVADGEEKRVSTYAHSVVTAAWDLHYVSTACQHAVHEACRRTCKFCDRACRCPCHQDHDVVPGAPAS